ncbi:Spy/CpxP family protein refolding chaperone [Aquincola sp. MAHUQ-54]|uniref:Spy/CpxP family protein refolding chaperone n=1 Tax=Aquincola agrisoli TaxID=3119538 RepID=A0AAW9Q9H1_9BURK
MMTTALSLSPSARRVAAGLLLAGAALAAPFASRAEAPPPPPGPHSMGGGLMGGWMMSGRGLDRMLDGVKATPEQREQIRKIADAAGADLKSQREAARGLRQQSVALFTAPTIDAAAAESLRQQMLAQQDQRSRRMLQAMLDVGNVLTPEQRQQLAERAAERRDGGHRHRPGERGPRGEREHRG